MAAEFQIKITGSDQGSPVLVGLGEVIDKLVAKGSAGFDQLASASQRSLTAVQKQAEALKTSSEQLGLGLDGLTRKLDLGAAGAAAVRQLQQYQTALKAGVISQEEFAQAQAKIQANFQKLSTGGGGLGAISKDLENLAQRALAPIAQVSPAAASGIESFLKSIGPTGLIVGGVAGAAVAAGAGIFSLAKSSAAAGDAITGLSTRTGVSVSTLSALGLQAKLSNTNVDTLAAGLRNAEDVFASAVAGNKEAVQSFRDLGLDLKSLVDLKPEERFATIARAVQDLGTNFERVAAGTNLFGKAFLELRPLIADVAEKGLPAIIAQGRQWGTVTDEAAARASQLSRELTLQQSKWDALVNAMKAAAGELYHLASAGFSAAGQALGGGIAPEVQVRAQRLAAGIPGADRGSAGAADVSKFSEGFAQPGGPAGADLTRAQLADLETLRQATRDAARDRVIAEQQANGQILQSLQTRQQKEQDLLGRELAQALDAVQTRFGATKASEEAQLQVITQYGQRFQALYTRQAEETRQTFVGAAQAASAAFRETNQQISTAFVNPDVKSLVSSTFGQEAWQPAISAAQRFTEGVVAAGKAGEQIKSLQIGKGFVDPSNVRVLEDFDRRIQDVYDNAQKGAEKAGLSQGEFAKALGTSVKMAADAGDNDAKLIASNGQVAQSFDDSAASVDRYAASLRAAKAAAVDLEAVQTKHSLAPSTLTVADAMSTATVATAAFSAGLVGAQSQVAALDNMATGLAATVSSKLQSAIQQADQELTALAQSAIARGFTPGGPTYSGSFRAVTVGQYGTYTAAALQARITALQQAGLGTTDYVSTALRNAGLSGVGLYAGSFASGGVVPGPLGQPAVAIVHGGERITPPGPGGGHTIIVNMTVAGPTLNAQRDLRAFADGIAATVMQRLGRSA